MKRFSLFIAMFLMLPVSGLNAEPRVSAVTDISSPVSTSSIVQVIIGLILVLAIIALSAWLLRRFGRFSSYENGALKVVATLSLGPRDKILLVQAGDKQILVGMSPGRMQTLCELENPIEFNDTESRFASNLPESIVSAFRNHSLGNKH